MTVRDPDDEVSLELLSGCMNLEKVTLQLVNGDGGDDDDRRIVRSVVTDFSKLSPSVQRVTIITVFTDDLATARLIPGWQAHVDNDDEFELIVQRYNSQPMYD